MILEVFFSCNDSTILGKIVKIECFACLFEKTANGVTAEVQFTTSDCIKCAIPSHHLMMSLMVTIRYLK